MDVRTQWEALRVSKIDSELGDQVDSEGRSASCRRRNIQGRQLLSFPPFPTAAAKIRLGCEQCVLGKSNRRQVFPLS